MIKNPKAAVTIAGPEGVSAYKDMAKPKLTETQPMTMASMAAISGLEASWRALEAGITSKAEINKTPTILKEKAMTIVSKVINHAITASSIFIYGSLFCPI